MEDEPLGPGIPKKGSVFPAENGVGVKQVLVVAGVVALLYGV
jgi:hypothetical protein